MRPTFRPLLAQCEFVSFEYLEEQSARLDALPLDSGARVSGLVRGERFSLPEHYLYPVSV